MPRYSTHVNVLDVLSFEDLVDLVAADTGIFKKDVRAVLKSMRKVIVEQVAGGKAVRWRDFGIFVPTARRIRVKDEETGKARWDYERHRVGFAFYPYRAVTVLSADPAVVKQLLARGEYDGPGHPYGAR